MENASFLKTQEDMTFVEAHKLIRSFNETMSSYMKVDNCMKLYFPQYENLKFDSCLNGTNGYKPNKLNCVPDVIITDWKINTDDDYYLSIDPVKVFLLLKNKYKEYFNREEMTLLDFENCIETYRNEKMYISNLLYETLKKYYSMGSNHNLLIFMINRISDIYLTKAVYDKNNEQALNVSMESITKIKNEYTLHPNLYNNDILKYTIEGTYDTTLRKNDIEYFTECIADEIQNCIDEMYDIRNSNYEYRNYFYKYEWDILTKDINILLDDFKDRQIFYK